MKINSSRVEDLSGHEAYEKVTVNVPPDDGATPAAPSEVHKVCLPPHKTTWEKLSQRLGEIFFPDDPFHRFRNQTPARRFLLGLQFFFPIFEWAPNYTLKLLRSDIIAGLTIASLSIPQGISYAKLANLPPIIGLCRFQAPLYNSYFILFYFEIIFIYITIMYIIMFIYNCRFKLRSTIDIFGSR